MQTSGKIVNLQTLLVKVRQLKKQKKTIAFTNGCFDILHYGHVRYLESAKRRDRVLIVGLNSDLSVRKIKGPSRPINRQRMRASVLAALTCVDFVVIFNEATPEKLIRSVQPDVLIKGADWRGQKVAGSEVVQKNGGKVEFIRYEEGHSTTGLIAAIKGNCCG